MIHVRGAILLSAITYACIYVHVYIYLWKKCVCILFMHICTTSIKERYTLYMIKNSHHLSFRNSQNGFSNWVSLMIYLFCKQYHTFVIILKMFFQKLSFIVKIVFVTLCSVRKMDVSLLCFKTFFGALYIQATTCALDVHLHKVFLIIWSNDLLNGVY